MIAPFRIPDALKARNQWVVWKVIDRDGKPTKVPCRVDGEFASSTDPLTWAPFEDAWDAYERGGYAGVGYVFAADDPLCGVDLDGCRDPKTGVVSEWAKKVITDFDTYAEVSPSETGVKLFVIGRNPLGSGKNRKVQEQKLGGKEPGVEVYDRGRFFAITGMRLKGHTEPQERQSQLDAFVKRYWPVASVGPIAGGADFRSHQSVVERARKYIARMPGAISGSNGHGSTFKVACVLVLGFGLPEGDALNLLREYNQCCDPPWSERDLQHKVKSANQQPGERNYLRNVSLERLDSVTVPTYTEPELLERAIAATTLRQAAEKALAARKGGNTSLVRTGLPDLDYAIGGGVEFGEMVILAARPSHGKSAVAMQCVHHWTKLGIPTLVISEEMSALALGKRTLQFLTSTPEEQWSASEVQVAEEIDTHFKARAECYVLESCGSAAAAAQQIEGYVTNHGVRAVVVDYAQLLAGVGKSRYEQMSNTSVILRQCASKHKIILVALCQLNREIEKRNKFMPVMADIRETGQLEQDADVIVFLVWPYKISSDQPPDEYQLFIAKNRNRAINAGAVKCRFLPHRQMLIEAPKGQDFNASDYRFDDED